MVVHSSRPGKPTQPQPKNLIQIGSKRKIAFVCSGGATKAGAFHLGVALALQEQGFKFYGGPIPSFSPIRTPEPMEISSYIGSSAGSIISTYLAAGYSLDNIFNSFLGRKPSDTSGVNYTPKILPRMTYKKMFKLKTSLDKLPFNQINKVRQAFVDLIAGDWDSFLHLKWLKATGIFSTAGIEQYMREEVLPSNRFQDYLADLFIVATQLNHSRKVVFGKYSYQPPPYDLSCQYDNDVGIADACAASTALPVIFAPHAIMNREQKLVHYIDGEIRDTLSTHVAADGGADLIIASHTHQPYHSSGNAPSLVDHGLPAIIVQSIYLLIEQKINNHIYNRNSAIEAIQTVNEYCSSQGISENHRNRITSILETQLHCRSNVDTIYIHPNPHDSQLFFAEHFSLSPKKMSDVVKSGFRAAIDTLRKYEFADRKKTAHAMGITT